MPNKWQPLSPRETAWLDQLHASFDELISRAVDHIDRGCPADTYRCCVGRSVTTVTDQLSRDELQILCEMAIARFARAAVDARQLRADAP